MPTYEYHCPKGHVFDVFQKMSDPPGAKCPVCNADAERKIVPGAGFLLKGDGFYITDTRSDAYKKEASYDNPGAVSKESGEKKGGTSESGAKESAPTGDKKESGAKDVKESGAKTEKETGGKERSSKRSGGKSKSGGGE